MTGTLALRHVALRVPHLARSVDFYADRLGFSVVERSAAHVDLATSPESMPVLRVEADPHGVAAGPEAAGLFHAALLFPTREALGAWVAQAANRGVEFDGFSDHGVSEAIYFSDPDGNGLEFYADRPRDQWPMDAGQVAMSTHPLDLRSLVAAGHAASGTLAGARWGHLHLRVTNLDRSDEFYRSLLGMVVTQRTYPGARFLAADGYHHHLGLNTWGRTQRAQPERALGLAQATFAKLKAEPAVVRDPDGISVAVEQA